MKTWTVRLRSACALFAATAMVGATALWAAPPQAVPPAPQPVASTRLAAASAPAAAHPAQAMPAAAPAQTTAPPAATQESGSHKRLWIIAAVVAVAAVAVVVIAHNHKHTVCTSTGCVTTGGGY